MTCQWWWCCSSNFRGVFLSFLVVLLLFHEQQQPQHSDDNSNDNVTGSRRSCCRSIGFVTVNAAVVSINHPAFDQDRFHYQNHQNHQDQNHHHNSVVNSNEKYRHYIQQEGNTPIIIRDINVHEISDHMLDYTKIHYECVNLRTDCDLYVNDDNMDACQQDSLFMYHHCPVSCHVCPTQVYPTDTSNKNDNNDTTDHYQLFHPIQYNIPLHERFGIHEYNPHRTSAPVNALFVHPGSSLLSTTTTTRTKMMMITIPPQRTVPEYETLLEDKVRRVNRYLRSVVDMEEQYTLVRETCRTSINHTDCAIWSIPSILPINDGIDRCQSDWDFMKQHGCYAFCYKCEYLHVESVCPINVNEKNALYAGDVHTMFTNLVQQYNDTYNITILSRPRKVTSDDDLNHEDVEMKQHANDTTTIDGPWIVQIDDFISVEEAQTLIELGRKVGYTRSQEVGEQDMFGRTGDRISHGRTSHNAWCETEECINHPVIDALYRRIQQVSNNVLVYDNSESLQLLQYTSGQYYRTHHDYVQYETKRQQGVRIITVFLYLNTMPESDDIDPQQFSVVDMEHETINRTFTTNEIQNNGGTNFPQLNITIRPKLGRAIIWSNVLDDQPNVYDERTEHQALVVTHGIKYGANAWFHQRAMLCEEEEE
jgi:prolyl 4-hydroxylase